MKLSTFSEMTRIEHTFFGLPFLLAGVFLPFNKIPYKVFWSSHQTLAVWILLAFLLARVSGMAFNQWIDHKIDAKNPRTSHRVLPSGRARPWQAACIAFVSLFLFLLVCAKINWLCFVFAPLTGFLIFIYPFTKRYHATCHLILGLIHFLAPLMAWIAITGRLSFIPVYLGTSALCLIAGNDMVYAIQDFQFDKKEGLHSVPVEIGISKTLWISRILHFLSLIFLGLLGYISSLHFIYYFGVVVAAIFFIYYHVAIHKSIFNNRLEKINKHFFWSNFTQGILMLSSITLGMIL